LIILIINLGENNEIKIKDIY